MDFQCVFWNGRTEKHQTSTAPSPLSLAFSHIHSKTACRGFKSFCPCQKSQVSLLRYLTFSLVCGRIWQRGAPAGPPAVRVVGACSPMGCVQARPRRQPRQVLLPLPKIALLLLQWRCFLSLGGTSWQQGAPAGSPAVRVVGTCSPVGCVQRRSRLPLRSVLGAPHWGAAPEPAGETSPSAPATKPAKTLDSRRFSFCTYCVRMGFILVQTAGFCTWFYLFPTVPTPPTPKTHPVSPFSGFSGCVFLFFAVFGAQNFCLLFCASCRIAVTS